MSRRLSAAALVGLDELTAPSPSVGRDTPPGASGPSASARRVTFDGEQLVVNLPLASIKPNTHQPRRTFDPKALDELASSIKQHGRVLQPILVRPAAPGQEDSAVRFEIVAGERRWRACAQAGLEVIRAIIEGVDDATSAEMALVENMARADLNPMDEARGCAALRDSFGMSVAEIARRVGRARTTISHLIRLLDLPDAIQQLFAEGALTEGHGRVLLRLGDFHVQQRIGARAAAEGWSVRELERQVDALLSDERPAAAIADADQTERLRQLTERLEPVFGANGVKIVPRRRGSYDIQVHCADLDGLTTIVDQLRLGDR